MTAAPFICSFAVTAIPGCSHHFFNAVDNLADLACVAGADIALGIGPLLKLSDQVNPSIPPDQQTHP